LLASITARKGYPLVPPSAHSYSYDADGNLASDGTTKYEWNAAGKPTSSTAGNTTTTYVHTGDGRRASSTAGSQTTTYLWDPLSPQILQTTAGKTSQRYSYGAGLIAQSAGPKTTELVSGRSGSLIATSGGSLTHYDYEPYGAPRQTSKPDTPTYAGALQLPNGNYLMGQREYNPTTATFISPDQGGSPQPYAYAAGNPISNNDLQGLDDIEGSLTNVSHISGWASTAALAGAVTCTFVRSCAPAIPIFMEVSAATGMLSAGTAGVLDSKACVVKGNCSALAADIAIGAVASRFPALGAARRTAISEVASQTGGSAVLKYNPDFALGQLTRNGTAKASELVEFAGRQGWVLTQKKDGPMIFVDANGVKRLAIKRGSPRTPGSELPHIEVRNEMGDRIDPFGNSVVRRSPSNHVPIDWDLP
jgi:RHS repeat-associated protein